MKHKHAANDYTRDMLPKNRREIFFDVLHLHGKQLLTLGLILLMFYLPILLLGTGKDIYISLLYQTADGHDSHQQEIVQLTARLAEIACSAITIPLLAFFSIGLAGISRPLRQYAWLENVHTPTDFGKGIRENYKLTTAFLVLCGLIGTLCLTVFYCSFLYISIEISVLSLLPIGISLLIVAPIAAIALVMIPIYQNTFTATVKNAFYVFSHCVWKTLGVLILCLLIWIPSLIPNFFCHFFGSIAAIMLTPLAILAFNLFCYDQFDKHLNPLVSPKLIGRGIKNEAG